MNAFKVLEKIEENGFEAYIVGGYVRNKILGIETSDIDICTNARVKDLVKIFGDACQTSGQYGAVKLIGNNSCIDITTYRKDLSYKGSRRDVEIEYVDNLIDDIKRRDFTMNTLCMSKNGSIIDLLNGRKDINNHIVRCVGDVTTKIKEDPLRMLRAVRFATVLDFKIEEELYSKLHEYNYLIFNLSKDRIKEELNKILLSKNVLRGLKILDDLGMLKLLEISYRDDIKPVSDICGMYSQLTIKSKFPFSKGEKENIHDIKEILKYGTIDEYVVYYYGLYKSMVAGDILGIDKDVITYIEKNLVIKKDKDIDITSDEICKTLGVFPGKAIGLVYDKIRPLILSSKLENSKQSIIDYIIANKELFVNERRNV